jgi:hypothetical protein
MAKTDDGRWLPNGGDLTFDQIVAACENIGYDLTCGRCAEVFYTGGSGAPHDEGCKARTECEAANRLRGVLPHLKIATEMARIEMPDGKVGLAVAVKNEKGGRITAQFESEGFLQDLETILGPGPTGSRAKPTRFECEECGHVFEDYVMPDSEGARDGIPCVRSGCKSLASPVPRTVTPSGGPPTPERSWIEGVDDAIRIVEFRQRHYEAYRAKPGQTLAEAGMQTHPATFATLEEILVFLKAMKERGSYKDRSLVFDGGKES